MELVWLYIAIAAVGVVTALAFRRTIRRHAVGPRVGAWILVVTGVGLLVMGVLQSERDGSAFSFGIACLLMGALQAEVARLEARIRELEGETPRHGEIGV